MDNKVPVSTTNLFIVKIKEENNLQNRYNSFSNTTKAEFPEIKLELEENNTGNLLKSLHTEIKLEDYEEDLLTGNSVSFDKNCENDFKPESAIEQGVLQTYEKPQTSEKLFRCNICFEAFARRMHLSDHKKIHPPKPFECNTCFRTFAQRSDLKKHERLHTGEKPFKCIICNKGFPNSFNLKSHERVHTGEKPFNCNTCFKMFSHSTSLTRHIKQVHKKINN